MWSGHSCPLTAGKLIRLSKRPRLAEGRPGRRPLRSHSLNVDTGQPAIDHIRAALEHGAHAITANKGPIVHAYRELRDLAAAQGKRFLFESTVMDGVPDLLVVR